MSIQSIPDLVVKNDNIITVDSNLTKSGSNTKCTH